MRHDRALLVFVLVGLVVLAVVLALVAQELPQGWPFF